jgi:hypothetical protein
MARQVAAIRTAFGAAMTGELYVEVRAALCLIDAECSLLANRSISVESGSVGQTLSANEFVNRAS